MSEILVIGVDPGKSTGVAYIRNTRLLYSGQWSPADAERIIEVILTDTAEITDATRVLAVERFIPQRRAVTNQDDAQAVIGHVEQIGKIYGVPVVLQLPADAKRVATNQRLREIGMWQSTRDSATHDMNDAHSATRHALLYLAHHHATTFEQILAGS